MPSAALLNDVEQGQYCRLAVREAIWQRSGSTAADQSCSWLSIAPCVQVTWKADGTRYLLLVCSWGCYLVDRAFRVRRVQMRFPRSTDAPLGGARKCAPGCCCGFGSEHARSCHSGWAALP